MLRVQSRLPSNTIFGVRRIFTRDSRQTAYYAIARIYAIAPPSWWGKKFSDFLAFSVNISKMVADAASHN